MIYHYVRYRLPNWEVWKSEGMLPSKVKDFIEKIKKDGGDAWMYKISLIPE